jgi:hypothetical protein
VPELVVRPKAASTPLPQRAREATINPEMNIVSPKVSKRVVSFLQNSEIQRGIRFNIPPPFPFTPNSSP